jgi:hypothetical protein
MPNEPFRLTCGCTMSDNPAGVCQNDELSKNLAAMEALKNNVNKLSNRNTELEKETDTQVGGLPSTLHADR